MIKNSILPLSPCAWLVACFIAGAAQAQSIDFSGDTLPTGNMGAELSTRIVIVGGNGTGTMTMSSGAVLNDIDGAVIGSRGGQGSVTLSSSSVWNSQATTVGSIGTGELRIESGAKLVTRGAVLSANAGGKGSVTVDGPDSSWEVSTASATRLTVGYAESGSLRVTNGAKVSSRHQLRTAELPGSTGLVEVDGANSSVNADSCHLSGAGLSTIRITNAGLVHCAGSGTLRHGTMVLSGADSKWSVGNDLYVEVSDAPVDATIHLGDGTVMEAGRRLLLASAVQPEYRSAATINIAGSTNPGAVLAPTLVFGRSQRGVINFNHTDASGNYVFAPSMTGTGTVNINEAGTTRFTGNNVYSGTTSVNAGVLRAGSDTGFSAASDFVVASGATLDTDTFSNTVGSLSNAGTVTMAAGGTSGVLTVAGNYSSNGGSLALNTALGDSDSPTELLVVNGDTSGTTTLNITNVGGTGAPTSGLGIMVVQVNGASNGTFRLPAPGYLQAGSFRYDLVKTGNHWYLVSEARAESAPAVGVVCTPAELSDAAGKVATCKVSLNAALTSDLSVNLALPAASARYTTTCSSPIVVPAHATEASCTITAVPNNTANDGDVTATLAIAPPTVADAYTVNGPAAQVLIKDKDKTGGDNGGGDNGGGNGGGDNGGGNGGGDNGGGTAVPHKVPTMGAVGLMAMASVLGLLGVRRTRQSGTPQSGTPHSNARRTPGTLA
ncbi:autotransporter outer membrane beta-barrel domain-containing protein [Comamonas sp.]|uniref:autotransporter outer membrane beta-barrel domain-containing protein n=1 Tax=Comamonas sp. TaxID=34028 RepID=UPI00289FF74B|nr:autotransporter outer membrane beta-barrel domain-containing protein [Comamonas sp.]